jgi:succinyl-diaminopimelate desuccinylase
MGSKQLMIDSIDSGKEEQILLLQAFVRAASPNPPGDTEAAAAVLANYLSSKGIAYELVTPQQGKPNLVSEFKGENGPGPRLVLNGHIDVLPVDSSAGGWERDPWSGDVVDGRVHGRGVVDMKSGTASLVIAFAHLYEQREHLKGTVALCAVADEETGGKWGTKYLLHQDAAKRGSGDVMLCAEPCGRTIRFSEKGTLRLSGTVRTKGALGAYLNLRLVSHVSLLGRALTRRG